MVRSDYISSYKFAKSGPKKQEEMFFLTNNKPYSKCLCHPIPNFCGGIPSFCSQLQGNMSAQVWKNPAKVWNTPPKVENRVAQKLGKCCLTLVS